MDNLQPHLLVIVCCSMCQVRRVTTAVLAPRPPWRSVATAILQNTKGILVHCALRLQLAAHKCNTHTVGSTGSPHTRHAAGAPTACWPTPFLALQHPKGQCKLAAATGCHPVA